MKHEATVSDPTEVGRKDMELRVYGGADNVQTGCGFLEKRATLTLRFGVASAQVYPTPQELRDMASASWDAAEEVEAFDSAAWFAADRAARKAAEQGGGE